MKKILIGLVAIVVAIVVAGVIVLVSMDFNQYRGLIAEKAKEATGRELTIAGNLELNISLQPTISVAGVTFANAVWGSRPAMVKLERLEAEVELLPLITGDIQVNRVILVGLDALLETDAKGRSNWEFQAAAEPKAAAPSEGAATIPVVKKVRAERVRVTYRDGKTGEKIVAVVDSLDLGADSLSSPLKLRLTGSYNGAAYQAAGEVGALSALAAGEPFPVDLTAEALGATLAVKGSIDQPQAGKGIDLGLKLAVSRLAHTMKRAAALVPALKGAGPVPAVAMTLSGNLKDRAGGYSLDGLGLKLGTSDLSGRLSVALGGARPKLDADLSSTLLDVDALLGPAKKGAPAKPAPARKAGDGRVFPNDPLPLDGLKAADAHIRFGGRKIRAGGVEITDVSVTLALNGGRLRVKPFAATVSGGKIGGEVTLDGRAKAATLDARIKVAGLDHGVLLKKMRITDIVTGKMDLDAELAGKGGSVRQLMAGLGGRLRLVTENGKIDSSVLNVISADVLAAANPFAESKGDKNLRCAVIHFDIKRGQAAAKTLLVETGGISLIGKGGIDLAREKLDLAFNPRSRKANLVMAVIPFTVGGTLGSPRVLPDAAAVAKGIASTAASIATGGLSTLLGAAAGATGVADDGTDETDYCRLALAGKPLVPVKKKVPPKKAAPAPEKKKDPSLGDAVKGLGSGLKSLFGK